MRLYLALKANFIPLVDTERARRICKDQERGPKTHPAGAKDQEEEGKAGTGPQEAKGGA